MRKNPLSTKQVFVWVMVLSVVFVLLPKRLTDRLDHLLTMSLSPLTSGVRDFTLSVTNKLDFSSGISESSQSNDRLEAEIRRQRNQLVHLSQELRRLQERNYQLSGLRQQFAMAQASFILADVVGSDTHRRREFLNQGTDDGVQVGQMVLGSPDYSQLAESIDQELDVYEMCVVGQITDVSSKTSSLRLLNDRGFRLPVIIEPASQRGESWRANGILQGQAMGKIVINMVEVKEFPIQVGDNVLACSNPRALPIEMMVGRVQVCRPDKDNPILWHIVVEPLVNLHAMQNVVVVDTQWK